MKIGFGRVDITPPLGTPVTGGWKGRVAEGIWDPLELNAVVLEERGERIAVVAADLHYMHRVHATEIRERIARETKIPAENILLHCLHQHTSTTGGIVDVVGSDYNALLKRRYIDAVRLAIADLAEATMFAAEQETSEEVSFIRRYRMKDGSVMTNPGTRNPNIDHPLGRSDNTVRLVRFTREGKGDIAIVGFQTHPDTMGGVKFTADWPGFVRRIVEAKKEGVRCICINGCQGDTNHFKPGRRVVPKEDPDARYEFTRRMGEIIADAALSVWDTALPLKEGAVSGAFEIQSIPTKIEGIERIEECKILQRKMVEDDPEVRDLPLAEKGDIRRIANLEDKTVFQRVPVSMGAVGEFALIGFGGEPFTEYDRILRRANPKLFLLTACNCNGSEGYLPTADAFEEGGYEARTTSFTPETPELLQGLANRLLARHQEKL